MNIKQENLLLLAREAGARANNWADCDVVQEAINQCKVAKTEEKALDALEYLAVSINYRKHLIHDKKDIELIEEYRKEFREECERLGYDAIISAPFVLKAYLSKSGDFLKVENEYGACLTVNRKREGWRNRYGLYELHAPIFPNTTTGSSVMVFEEDGACANLAGTLRIIKEYRSHCPSFFGQSDRAATKFQTIEQAVEQHGNILGFSKVK